MTECIPKLCKRTVVTMSEAVIDSMVEWELRDRIKDMTSDTIASNAGTKGGVSLRLEIEFDRALLHLECRHHVPEFVITGASVYDSF